MEDIDDPGASDAISPGVYFALDLRGMRLTNNMDVSCSQLFRYRGFKRPKTREDFSLGQDLSGPSRTGQYSRYEIPSKMETFRSADRLA